MLMLVLLDLKGDGEAQHANMKKRPASLPQHRGLQGCTLSSKAMHLMQQMNTALASLTW